MTVVFSVFAVLGMACVVWLAYGWLLMPEPSPLRVVVLAAGTGEGVEQTVKGLLWLRKNRLWRGTVSIEDDGLSREGLQLTLALARQEGVEFAGRNLQSP